MPPAGRPTGDPALKTPERRACLRTVKARHSPCYRCGQPIDYTLTDRHHPGRWVGDEIHPRHLGGDPADPRNVVASHWRCNAQAGAHITNRIRAARRADTSPTLVDDDW